MKTLSTNILCCSCRLYKIGILIGLLYLIPNLLIIAQVIVSVYKDYTLVLICGVTAFTSILLIQGLKEDRYQLLLPWLANITILILFNIMLVTVQFKALSIKETKQSFYMEFGFFIALELQILFWYIIYCLFKRGHEKSKINKEPVSAISNIVESKEKDFFTVNLIAKDSLNGDSKVISI